MAKDKKQAEDANENAEATENVKEEKKSKGGSELNMKSVIIAVAGALIAVVLIVFALYWFLIRPDIIGQNQPKEEAKAVKVEIAADEETLKFQEELAQLKAQASTGNVKGLSFGQTPDIITNTNPPDWYIVVQVGVEFKNLQAGEGGHGGDAGLPAKLSSEISSYITKYCGSKSIEEVLNKRDSLDILIFKELEPIFIKEKCYLHKITIPKFVTQRA